MHKIFIEEDEIEFKLNQTVVEQWTHSIRLELIKLADSRINDVYESQRGRIQSALYAFEDCQSVIEDYKQLEYFDVKNAAYLKLYGLLQAFFVQQDSIRNLQLAIFDKADKLPESYEQLQEIRDIRNITTGHPTNKGGEYYLISQITLNKYGYQIIRYKKNANTESNFIKIYDLLENQDRGVNNLMIHILQKMQQL